MDHKLSKEEKFQAWVRKTIHELQQAVYFLIKENERIESKKKTAGNAGKSRGKTT